MQLHQFLRFLSFGTPIIIFDIQGIEICKVQSKDEIDLELYEYPVMEISVGAINLYKELHGLFITIQK